MFFVENGLADLGGADGDDIAVDVDDFRSDFVFAVLLVVFTFKTGFNDAGAGVETIVFGDVDIDVVDPEAVVVDVANRDDAVFFGGNFGFFQCCFY